MLKEKKERSKIQPIFNFNPHDKHDSLLNKGNFLDFQKNLKLQLNHTSFFIYKLKMKKLT